ncbi:nuclear transport factor 2 family protein [Phytomonospora sp. NPDC050363]|uniref:nuclear transport factor 2 family protein n=1 Tax=Phytomonospora sp. NPDC050363 TaxID=3155642 RepID=UPI0033F5A9E0
MIDNKRLVLKVLDLYGKGDLDALEPLMRDDYADHGLPFQTTTRADWIAKARRLPLTEIRVDIRHLAADGDHVTMFSRRSLPGGGLDIAVADIFRIADGLVAERWEVVEPIAADAPDPLATLRPAP